MWSLRCLIILSAIYCLLINSGSQTASTIVTSDNLENFIDGETFFEIIYPEELQYTYRIKMAHFGNAFKHPMKAVRLVVTDPEECCSFPNNANQLKGAVALATRSECSFLTKAIKAEEAGAIGIIITDNDINNIDQFIVMANDDTKRNPTIPAAFLLGANGYMIKQSLSRRRENVAIINIPVNKTYVKIHQLNEPPWVVR